MVRWKFEKAFSPLVHMCLLCAVILFVLLGGLGSVVVTCVPLISLTIIFGIIYWVL